MRRNHCFVVLFFFLSAPVRAAEPTKDAAADKVLASLQGVWRMLSRERNEEVTEVAGKPHLWQIKNDRLLFEGREIATLAVQEGSPSFALDLRFKEPERVYEAVAAVKDGRWKICLNRQTEAARDRPTEFTTKGNANYQVLVFERLEGKAAEEALAAQRPRGYVGVQIARRDEGILILDTLKDSPAEKAGLKKGDVVVRIGTAAPTTLTDAIAAIQVVKPGNDLVFTIQRDGKEREVTIEVAEVPLSLLYPLNPEG